MFEKFATESRPSCRCQRSSYHFALWSPATWNSAVSAMFSPFGVIAGLAGWGNRMTPGARNISWSAFSSSVCCNLPFLSPGHSAGVNGASCQEFQLPPDMQGGRAPGLPCSTSWRSHRSPIPLLLSHISNIASFRWWWKLVIVWYG